jgi:hypothetical protein
VFDAAAFVLRATSPEPARWFHPHHLLYGWLAHGVAVVAGPDGLVATMQWLSALSAAIGVGVYAHVLRRVLGPGRALWAAGGAMLLGVSSMYWVNAVETDAYAIATAGLAGAFVCHAAAQRGRGPSGHVAAGLLTGVAILFHQLLSLFAIAVATALVLVGGPERWRRAVGFFVPAAVLPGIAYLAIGARFGFYHDARSFLAWLVLEGHANEWEGFRPGALVEGCYGLAYAVVSGGRGLLSPRAIRAVGALGFLALSPPITQYVRHSTRDATARATLVLCGCWIAAFASFSVLHWPEYSKHWLFVLMPLFLLVVGAGAELAGRARWRGAEGVGLALLALAVLGVGGLNYVRTVWPLTRPENDHDMQFAEYALARVPAADRVVTSIGIPALVLVERRGAGAVFIVPGRPHRHETTADVVRALERFVTNAWDEGRTVWVFEDLLEPPHPRDPRSADIGAAVARALDRLRRHPGFAVLDTGLLRTPLTRHRWDIAGSL